MTRVFTVTTPDSVTFGQLLRLVLEGIEPGSSGHTLMQRTDEQMRITVTHSRLRVTVQEITETKNLRNP